MISDFEGLIGSLYDVIDHPEAWKVFGKDLADATGSTGCEIALFDAETFEYRHFNFPILTSREEQEYFGDWLQHNPRTAYARQNGGLGAFYADQECLDIRAFERSEFTRWLNQVGFHFAAGISAPIDQRSLFTIVVHRSPSEQRFTTEGLALLRRLAPHMHRVVSISSRVKELQTPSGISERLNEHSFSGVIVFDRRGNVLAMNQKADRLLQSVEAVSIDPSGEVSALDARAVDFVAAIRRSVNENLGIAERTASLEVKDRTGRKTLRVMVLAATQHLVEDDAFSSERPVAISYLIPSAASFEDLDAIKLPSTIGLSARKSDIAKLLFLGKPPKLIANQLSISENTVRVTIQAIYKHFGVRSQIEFIRLFSDLILFQGGELPDNILK